MSEKISIIVPTYGRQKLFPMLYDCFAGQSYSDRELLVFDDTEVPSDFFNGLSSVRYFHSPKRLSIGEKRNFLIQQAQGEIIAHFDDDDYYAPEYLGQMRNQLGEADFVHLTGWFVYGVSQHAFGYWATQESAPVQYVLQSKKPLALIKGAPNDSFIRGYGFSYVYRKKIWHHAKFPDRNHGEDYEWVQSLDQNVKFRSVLDDDGIVLHIIHLSNTSRCFPQYHLPANLLKKIFGRDVLRYVQE